MGNNLVSLSGKRVSGAEHHVWLDEGRKLALKIPNPLGKLWQKMDAAHVERDLSVLRQYGIPIVPTRVHHEPDTIDADGTRKQIELVLEQPLLQPSHPISYRDLMHFERTRAFLLDILRKGEALYKERSLGLDILGGKAYSLPFGVLNPFQRKMQAEIGNFLVADKTIPTPEAWIRDDRRKQDLFSQSRFNRRRGNVIVQEGDIRLCDVRLFDFSGDGAYDQGMALLLKSLREIQSAALWTLLEGLGVKPEITFETRLQRMARCLVQRATPKMRSYAEEVG